MSISHVSSLIVACPSKLILTVFFSKSASRLVFDFNISETKYSLLPQLYFIIVLLILFKIKFTPWDSLSSK